MQFNRRRPTTCGGDSIAEKVAEIIERPPPQQPLRHLGDMNDAPDAEPLEPPVGSDLGLVNGLADPHETRPAKPDQPPPASNAWTHRFKETGKPAHYAIFDHIWLNPSLADNQTEAWIDRRTTHDGHGERPRARLGGTRPVSVAGCEIAGETGGRAASPLATCRTHGVEGKEPETDRPLPLRGGSDSRRVNLLGSSRPLLRRTLCEQEEPFRRHSEGRPACILL